MSGFSIEERGCMALEYYRHNNYEVVKVNFKFTFPDSPIPCDKTILKYFRKIRYFGFAEDKKYSREAPISDNIEIRDKVLDAIEANPKWSHRRLAIETGIKKTTYRTILEKNGVKVFKFTPVQKLYEGDASRRFLFCKKILDYIEMRLITHKDLFISDESYIELDPPLNRQNIRIWKKENPHAIVEKTKVPKKFCMWTAISGTRIIGPYFIERTVDENVYQQIISRYYGELNEYEKENTWFQQDGAPCHTSSLLGIS